MQVTTIPITKKVICANFVTEICTFNDGVWTLSSGDHSHIDRLWLGSLMNGPPSVPNTYDAMPPA